MARPHFDRRQREPQTRVNHRIRADPVRVIDADGSMLGVMSNREAIRAAQAHGLDLVEVNPKADPPVCKIMDFGRFKYEEKKRASEAKRKQTTVELKEIKLRPKTDDHDLNFKLRAARRFVETGNKVKFVVRFRGREIAHPDQAQQQLVWLLEQLEDISNADNRPAMEGRTMTVMVSPKPQILQAIAAQKSAEAVRKREQAKLARRSQSATPDGSQPAADQAADQAADDDKQPIEDDRDVVGVGVDEDNEDDFDDDENDDEDDFDDENDEDDDDFDDDDEEYEEDEEE